MIAVRGVSRSFDGVAVLNDATFTATNGRICGLLGPNGAGKSTMMRIITGLLRTSTGSVEIDGVSVGDAPLRARQLLGVLPDARGLHARLTAREHLFLSARLYLVPEAEIGARVDLLAARLQMAPLLDRRVAGFSQGERMKVALGRALVADPPNLLLDEPQNGLDVEARRLLRELCLTLRDEGKTVVLSSHQMAEVATIADDVVVLVAGTIRYAGSLSSLRTAHGDVDLEEAFVRVVHASSVAATAPNALGLSPPPPATTPTVEP